MDITISLKAIKNIMSREFRSHYQSACQSLHNGVQRGFVNYAHNLAQERIENAQTEQELESILEDFDYRMSLQEWVNSL